MKLLHILPTYLPATRYGGPVYAVHALCRSLADRGHDVSVYTTNIDGPGTLDVPVAREIDVDGVHVTYFSTGIGRVLYRSPAMNDKLRKEITDYDVVHLHSAYRLPTSVAAGLARKFGVPYIFAPRGMLVRDLITRRSRLLKMTWIAAFEKRNLEGADAVHVTSEVEAQEIAKLGLNARRVAIIPNGVEDPPVVKIWNRRQENANPKTVLSLGRLNWKKGLDRLIRAMSLVPSAQLLIAGDDEDNYRAALEALSLEIGVRDRVRFLGPVHGRGKWDLLASADIFVLPSYSENFANSVLEAMASGIPVVVTPEVGLATTVADCGAGLVASGSPEELASALNGMIANPDCLKKMGDAGRRAAQERFAWDSIAREMEVLYSGVTNCNRSSEV